MKKRMKIYRRLVALLLSGVVFASQLPGCSKKTQNDPTSSTSSEGSDKSRSEQEEQNKNKLVKEIKEISKTKDLTDDEIKDVVVVLLVASGKINFIDYKDISSTNESDAINAFLKFKDSLELKMIQSGEMLSMSLPNESKTFKEMEHYFKLVFDNLDDKEIHPCFNDLYHFYILRDSDKVNGVNLEYDKLSISERFLIEAYFRIIVNGPKSNSKIEEEIRNKIIDSMNCSYLLDLNKELYNFFFIYHFMNGTPKERQEIEDKYPGLVKGGRN